MKKYLIILLLSFLYSCKIYKLDLTKRDLLFEDNLETLNNFNIKDGEFYNQNDVWFSKDQVKIIDEGLEIRIEKDSTNHCSWQGERYTTWTSGMIDTRGKVEYRGGVWQIEAKLNCGWPAIWLLKPDFYIDGYKSSKIIPEIDIVESIRGRFKHTIHYGYSDVVYRRFNKSKSAQMCDNEFHKFTVEFLNNGYNFYIDGIRTASFTSNDPEFVSNQPNYLIINNANHTYTNDTSEIVIKNIKIYGNNRQ